MSRKIVLLMLLISVMLVGCGAAKNQGQDPALVKVELATNPTPATTGQQVTLVAHPTGFVTMDQLKVEFDVRQAGKNDLPVIVEAKLTDNDTFTGMTKFKHAGTYDVYIHLYQDELHVTKKRTIEVVAP